MDNQTAQELIDQITDALYEITYINKAAGRTVFNPAVREGLKAAIATIEAERVAA